VPNCGFRVSGAIYITTKELVYVLGIEKKARSGTSETATAAETAFVAETSRTEEASKTAASDTTARPPLRLARLIPVQLQMTFAAMKRAARQPTR